MHLRPDVRQFFTRHSDWFDFEFRPKHCRRHKNADYWDAKSTQGSQNDGGGRVFEVTKAKIMHSFACHPEKAEVVRKYVQTGVALECQRRQA